MTRIQYGFDERAMQRLRNLAAGARDQLTDEQRAEYLARAERYGDYLSWTYGDDGDVLLLWAGAVLVTVDAELVRAIISDDEVRVDANLMPPIPDDLSSLPGPWDDRPSDSAGESGCD